MESDSQLQHDVLAELKWEPSVNAAKIDVDVKDGVLTLAGQVESSRGVRDDITLKAKVSARGIEAF
jgi:osmotically-inducible protein OsmY